VTILFFACQNSYGQDFPFSGRINSDNINLRSGPNTNYESLDSLSKNTKVKVVAEKFGWYKIAPPKSTAYFISADYVKKSSPGEGIITGDNVNIRAKPGLSATIIGSLKQGVKIEIKNVHGGWYEIYAPENSVYAWVFKKFITYDPPAQEEIPPKEEKQLQVSITKLRAKAANSPIASGKIKPMGIFFRRKGSHKLMINDETAYYLKGDKKALNRFAGYRVNLYGKIDPDTANGGIPVIEVERIEPVQ